MMFWKQDEEYDFDVLTLQDGFEVLKDTQNNSTEGSLLFNASVEEEASLPSSFPAPAEERHISTSHSSIWSHERTYDSKPESTSSVKDFKRFGKVQDREVFRLLHEKCKEYECQISDFWRYKELIHPCDQILDEILKEIGWKNGTKSLLFRIRKLGTCKRFSARDKKLLISLICKQTGVKRLKKHKESLEIDFKKLEYFFPGKSASDLLSYWENMEQYN